MKVLDEWQLSEYHYCFIIAVSIEHESIAMFLIKCNNMKWQKTYIFMFCRGAIIMNKYVTFHEILYEIFGKFKYPQIWEANNATHIRSIQTIRNCCTLTQIFVCIYFCPSLSPGSFVMKHSNYKFSSCMVRIT